MKRILQYIAVAAALFSILACQSKLKINDPKDGPNPGPKITKPVVKKIWVPEQIEDDGRVLIEGHYKWLLEKDSTWSR
jgi:predicted small lipoprotein YifL